MKVLFALILLMPTFLSAKVNQLSGLNKLVQVSLNDKIIEFVVTHSDDRNVYYRSNDYEGYENLLRISVSYNNNFHVEVYDNGISYKVEGLENLSEEIRYDALTQEMGSRTYSMEKNGFEYYFINKLQGPISKTELKLSNIFAKTYFERIDSKGMYTSELEYRACDGCEHGDQFFISSPYGTINVVYQDFGSFYTPTCDEELNPWLSQLIELKVPFSYYGTIDASSPDYWEGTNDHWMAGKGFLLVGSKKENHLVRFMQLVVFRTAEAFGANPLSAYDDIIKNGKFVGFTDGALSFDYRGLTVQFVL